MHPVRNAFLWIYQKYSEQLFHLTSLNRFWLFYDHEKMSDSHKFNDLIYSLKELCFMWHTTHRHHASFQRRYDVVRCRIDVETTSCAYRVDTHNKIITAESFPILLHSLQTHRMYSTVKWRGNERGIHVVCLLGYIRGVFRAYSNIKMELLRK